MTPEERLLVLSLVVVPGRQHEDHREDVLRHFGASDGRMLGLALLNDAIRRKDAVDVEMALVVSNTFGFTSGHLQSLVVLSSAGWHQKHEDVVSALGELRDPAGVDALYEVTQWIPDYLEFDESRALARKAIWALGKTPGEQATGALGRLVSSDDEIVQEEAARQLKRR
jgi:hypothetical protein